MALFGEKCVRCGNRRTKREVEGVPTCESCEAALQTRARAETEDARECPIDGTSMGKDVVLGVIIDRCSSCGGVWLDGGELELIRESVAEGMAMDLARAVAFPG